MARCGDTFAHLHPRCPMTGILILGTRLVAGPTRIESVIGNEQEQWAAT